MSEGRSLREAANPRLNPNQVANLLRRSAERRDRQRFGHGVVNAAAALGVN
jgi:hypothetical protein